MEQKAQESTRQDGAGDLRQLLAHSIQKGPKSWASVSDPSLPRKKRKLRKTREAASSRSPRPTAGKAKAGISK